MILDLHALMSLYVLIESHTMLWAGKDIELKENEVYGVSIAVPGQTQENVMMSRSAQYATIQDLHTTGDANYSYIYVPIAKKDHTDVI